MLRVINTAARMAPKSVVAASPRPVNMRFASTVTDPKVKANALIDALPGNSLVSKTGILTLGTALAAAAISQELVVANEEFVVAGAFIIFATYLGQMIRAPYTQWADGQIQKTKDILNVARAGHTDAVKTRIESVGELKDVEALTQTLFELSKQTAALEHETFALRQQAAITADVKSVLDSWVRHEAQVREAEQRDLVSTVLANVQAQLTDKKLQRDILMASVAEIENLVKLKAI